MIETESMSVMPIDGLLEGLPRLTFVVQAMMAQRDEVPVAGRRTASPVQAAAQRVEGVFPFAAQALRDSERVEVGRAARLASQSPTGQPDGFLGPPQVPVGRDIAPCQVIAVGA